MVEIRQRIAPNRILGKGPNLVYMIHDHFLAKTNNNFCSPQLSARTNDTASSDCKCCRVCGTIYQKDRSCNCVPKSYPKAVAYELAFVDDDEDIEVGDSETGQCGKINMEIKSIEKNVPLPSSRSRGRVKLPDNGNGTHCACRGLQRTIKRCDCECREQQPKKFYNEKKNTLQVGFAAFGNASVFS